jgi:glycosyltransferase involved in cell wall biosynthesis
MSSRLRLDYVSPLPPVRSGIADYSLDLLPWLEPLCDLRVLRLPDQPVATEIEQRWPLVDIDRAGEEGRLPLYHVGNNKYHKEVWHLANRLPGILALHDIVLHHLLVELTLGEGDLEAYSERLVEDHGWVGEMVAKARRWTELGQTAVFELAAHRALLRKQRGVLVHSEWAAARLREEDADLRVRVVPMGVPLPEIPDESASQRWRQEAGIPDGSPLLGSFGFQTPIKRTDRVIAALAREAMADVHLAIGGEVSQGLELEHLARELGVMDRVHMLGFLPFDEFETAIGACDLCLNLRYPTAGETSASLLRVLALGRPVIVSDYAQFTELPDPVAVKVPLGEGEVESLAAEVGRLLGEPEKLAAMELASREYVEANHAPARAAAAVISACQELAEQEPPGGRPAEIAPPSTLTWRELPGELVVEGADLPWLPGEARDLRIRLANTGRARWLSAEHELGGVMIDIQWRRERAADPGERHWVELPHDLSPGESMTLRKRVRRPLGDSNLLIVEPHVREICGFGAIGGPVYVQKVE